MNTSFLNLTYSEPSLLNITRSTTAGASFKIRKKISKELKKSETSIISYEPSFSEKLYHRKSHNKIEINPKVAARVVKEYFIPMFETNTKLLNDKKRSMSIGIQNRAKFQEKYKLSDEIKEKLATTTGELDKLKGNWENTIDEIEKIKNEITETRLNVEDAKTFLENLKFQLKLSGFSLETDDLITFSVEQKNRSLFKLCEDTASEKSKLRRLCSKEREENDNLKIKTKELVHWSALLKMQNDIMGERLKGIFDSVVSLCGENSSSQKLDLEKQFIINSAHEINNFEEITAEKTFLALEDASDFQSENQNILKHKLTNQLEMRKIRNQMKDIISRKQKDLQKAMMERDFFRDKFQSLEKESKDFSETYEKLRQYAREVRPRNRQNNADEEKMCKNCGKSYYERENFNWSCSIHPNDWNGSIYWCCGKTRIDAPGCIKHKHDPRTDELDQEEDQEDKAKHIRCSSCKGAGHTPRHCTKDPNARSTVDILEEKERLTKFHKQRTKMGTMSLKNHTKLIGMIQAKLAKQEKAKLGKSAFIDISQYKDTLSIKNAYNMNSSDMLIQHKSYSFKSLKGGDSRSEMGSPELSVINHRASLDSENF